MVRSIEHYWTRVANLQLWTRNHFSDTDPCRRKFCLHVGRTAETEHGGTARITVTVVMGEDLKSKTASGWLIEVYVCISPDKAEHVDCCGTEIACAQSLSQRAQMATSSRWQERVDELRQSLSGHPDERYSGAPASPSGETTTAPKKSWKHSPSPT